MRWETPRSYRARDATPLTIVVPGGDHDRVPHVRHVVHGLVQRVAPPIHPQAKVDHRLDLLGVVDRVEGLPVLEEPLHPAQHARRAPLPVRVENLYGMDRRRLGRTVVEPGRDARGVGPVVVGLVVERGPRADEPSADAGGPIVLPREG